MATSIIMELVEVLKTALAECNIERKQSEIASNYFVRIEDVAKHWRHDNINRDNSVECLISERIKNRKKFEGFARERNLK